MPNRREREAELGKFQVHYGANPIKSFLNLIIGGGLLLIGVYGTYGFIQEGEIGAFSLLFLALGLIGVVMLGLTYRQRTKFIDLYEQGLYLRTSHEPAQTLRYDQIEDFAPIVGRLSAKPTRAKTIAGFVLFLPDKKSLSLTSDISHWSKAAEQIQQKVIAARVPPMVALVKQGKAVHFNVMMGFYMTPTPLQISLTVEGVQADDKLLNWDKLRITQEGDEWNSLVAQVKSPTDKITFLMENYPTLAYYVIKGCLG